MGRCVEVRVFSVGRGVLLEPECCCSAMSFALGSVAYARDDRTTRPAVRPLKVEINRLADVARIMFILGRVSMVLVDQGELYSCTVGHVRSILEGPVPTMTSIGRPHTRSESRSPSNGEEIATLMDRVGGNWQIEVSKLQPCTTPSQFKRTSCTVSPWVLISIQ